MIKAIAFDFDDTLVNTRRSKYKLMQAVFKKNFNKTRGVKKAYKSMAGEQTSRKKTRKLILAVIGRKASNDEVNAVEFGFNSLYKRLLSTCPLMISEQNLKEISSKKPTFIVSLESEAVVKQIISKCGFASYFKEILGGPKSKIRNFEKLFSKYGLKPSEVLFFGDSKNDAIVAKKLGIPFVGVRRSKTYQDDMKAIGARSTFATLNKVDWNKMLV